MKAALLLFTASMAFAADAGAVAIRIAAEPQALLPGLFPSLRISITNEGPAPEEVPVHVALQVIPPRGEPFIAYTSMRGDDWTTELVADKPLILVPGETRDVSFWARDEWFGSDARFRTTGTFRLQLVADQGLDSRKLSGVSRVLDQPGLVQPLVSNEATFTAIEPTGVDAAVWNVMKGHDETCSPEVTSLIWREYPTSGYAAYCVQKHGDPLQQIASYKASLAMSPHAYRAEVYRVNIARLWISRGWKLIARDVDAAADAYQEARVILEPLSRTAISPDTRTDASALLQNEVLTRERILDLHRAAQGDDDRAIRFEFTCFESLGNGTRKVWFGYKNPNSKVIDIPIGKDNKFTPAPFDRKQPTTFRPGTFVFAFHVVTTEPVLVWHLQGKTTQFKVPGSAECREGYDPGDPATWGDGND